MTIALCPAVKAVCPEHRWRRSITVHGISCQAPRMTWLGHLAEFHLTGQPSEIDRLSRWS